MSTGTSIFVLLNWLIQDQNPHLRKNNNVPNQVQDQGQGQGQDQKWRQRSALLQQMVLACPDPDLGPGPGLEHYYFF